MSGLFYAIPEVTTISGAAADTAGEPHGIAAIGQSYVAAFAFGNPSSAPSTFVALSSAPESVDVMLGAHGSNVITAPYLISAVLVKRAKK